MDDSAFLPSWLSEHGSHVGVDPGAEWMPYVDDVSWESIWWSGELMELSSLLLAGRKGVPVLTEFWFGVVAGAVGNLAVDQLRIHLAAL